MSLFLISSCSDPATVGIELAPGNNQIGVVFEEFVLPAEVVLLDSFNTTNQNILIVGEEVDPFFGKTSATGYSRTFIDSRAKRPESNALLDSIFFTVDIININGTNLGGPKRFSIHKLTEPILDTLYYNFDELSYEENPFTAGEIVFGEKTDSIASFQLEEEFAEEIFNKMRAGAEFNNLFTFREYFPGIALKAKEGDNSSARVRLGANTAIKVYYRNAASDTVSTLYSISTSSSRNFSGIKSDRSGTPTDAVTEYQKSYDVGPLVGIKAGLGMVIKLDTSPLDAFLDTLSGVIFNNVSLELGAIEDPAEGVLPSTYFRAYFSDGSNRFLANPAGKYYTIQDANRAQVGIDSDSNKVPLVEFPASFIYISDKKLYGQNISAYINALFRGDLTRKDWILYGGNIVDKRRTSLGTDPLSPQGNLTTDQFGTSLRQFKVDKNKIKVKVIYSKSR
ncbi:hypothetical protein J2X69_003925 [Algoriphagus sp. 4150]|nr:hypothetical protein [Algoriphagus sp. 4150]